MTLISSTRFFNGALLAGAMALISTEVAVAQPAPGTADSSGRLVQTWDKTFPRSEKVDHQKVTFKNRYGITLAADVYLPKDRGNKKLAALVLLIKLALIPDAILISEYYRVNPATEKSNRI